MWFPIDDKAHSDDRFRRAGLNAAGLYAMAGSYCADQLTDGFVPDWFVRQFPNGSRSAQRLITERIWARVSGDGNVSGYRFVDLPHSVTRAASEERRRKWRDDKLKRKSGGSVSAAESTSDSAAESISESNPASTSDSEADPPRFPWATTNSKTNNGGLRKSGTSPGESDPPPSTDPLLNGAARTPLAAGEAGDQPPLFCPRHRPYGTDRACVACGEWRRRRQEWEDAQRHAAAAADQAEREARADCPDCHGSGWVEVEQDGDDALAKCRHPRLRLTPDRSPMNTPLPNAAGDCKNCRGETRDGRSLCDACREEFDGAD